MKPKRVTIADIAQKSGYSKTAVSFAFNCPERISKEAVDHILAIASDMNYIPDPMARNFSLGRHLSIGFLIPETFSVAFDNPHYVEVLKGVGTLAEANDYTVTLIPPRHASIAEAIKNATVDGIIAFGLVLSSETQEALKRRKLPFVSIDCVSQEDTTSIAVDDVGAAKTQMMEALKRGHRTIAVIGFDDTVHEEKKDYIIGGVSDSRLKGYDEAYETFGFKPDYIKDTSVATHQGGKEAARRILSSSRPTCIVCMSDVQAIGAMEEAEETGLSVPKDISIIGFDGIGIKGNNGLTLSTIEQNGYEKGKNAAEVLFGLINGEDQTGTKHLVPFRFIEGETLRSL